MARPMRPMPKMPARRPRSVPRRQPVGAFLHPAPFAQVVFRARKLAHGIDQQADRRIGDLLGQHVRRVGDHHVRLAGVGGIDRS